MEIKEFEYKTKYGDYEKLSKCSKCGKTFQVFIIYVDVCEQEFLELQKNLRSEPYFCPFCGQAKEAGEEVFGGYVKLNYDLLEKNRIQIEKFMAAYRERMKTLEYPFVLSEEQVVANLEKIGVNKIDGDIVGLAKK